MRMMMKVSFPVETGNAAVRNGSLGPTIQKILADLKPEAAYYAEDNGTRTGYIFFQMTESSQLPGVAEPWFLAFDAAVEFHPVMVPEDLAKAAPDIEWAAKNFA